MRTYTVHEPRNAPPGRIERAEGLVFVKDGFSWMAVLFTPFWMIFYRLWWPLLGYVLLVALVGGLRDAIAALGLMSAETVQDWTMLVMLAIGLLIGFEAGALRRWDLDRRGWSTLGAVTGRTADDCERRFFELWLPAQADTAAASGGPAVGEGMRALPSGA
jgi:hypothetical protein